jgi:hypothetical protein
VEGAYFYRMDETLTLLSDSQIAVYPVNASGTKSGPSIYSDSLPSREDEFTALKRLRRDSWGQFSISEMAQRVMKMIAAQTGGVAYYNKNEMADTLEKCMEDGTTYYTVSYTPKHTNWNGKYRNLEISSQRGQLKLRYRPGYFAFDPLKANSESRTFAKRELDLALYSPVLATGLPFYGTAQPLANSSATSKQEDPHMGSHGRTLLADETVLKDVKLHPVDVGFLIQLSELSFEQMPNDLRRCSVELFVGVFARNKLVGHFEDAMAGKLQPDAFEKMRSTGGMFHTTVQVPEGKVRLRLIVRDNRNGRIGSLDVPYPNVEVAK